MLAQENRLIAISTPLGENELALYKAEIVEDLAKPFSIKVELVSENDNISLDDIMGQNVTVRLNTADNVRFFNGFVTEFHQLPNNDRYSRYGATIRPWFWFLNLSENCRIFQEKSYPDIISVIFDELGFSDYEIKLTGTYQPQEYVVQFNESNFNFVTRLMEQEGIYYYFEHTDGKHTFIMADDNTVLPDSGDVTFYQHKEVNNVIEIECISMWENYRQLVTGGIRLSDFDFETPSKDLEFVSTDPKTGLLSSLEKYNYPGKYKDRGKGTEYVRLLMEKENVAYETKIAKSNVRHLFTGSNFTLKDHHRDDQNSQYLITQYRCNLLSDDYITNSNQDSSEIFASEFTAIPSTVAYRPQLSAIKPKMIGPQTAMVVGKAGEEIWTDKYGRVKVHFHWDRYGNSDEQSSCWIRVAQNWAGKNWGQIQIPRIGQEVLVDFLGGDPDRPIIVGSVYNGSTMPPYDLPANATQSGIKTRSTKGGNASNFNELRFEDEKGNEELYIHAEKDYNSMIENCLSETIGNNKTTNVGASHSETIGANMQVTVGGSLTETVLVNVAETVGVSMELTVGGFYAETVGAQKTESVGGNKSESTGGDKSESVGKNRTLNVSKDLTDTIGTNRSLSVGKDNNEAIKGKSAINVEKELTINAKKIQLIADDEISFKAGKAMITMKKNGDITLKGKKITVNGSGDVTIKGSKIKEN
ncbi:type VI secretion system tip protein TssI/VgrG [uncultured Paraglaciecola sp.]|uniref:type VI secretion system Vgr family protein n=1 Tax=uncultured Paraglaciecola sp. TaxID=1765024 RepID=UPI0030D76EE5